MKPIRRFIHLTGLSMAMAVGTPVFAQAAPVYDADSMQRDPFMQQDEQRINPAPMPAQNTDSGFVRIDNEAQAQQQPAASEEQMRQPPNAEAAARVEALQDQVQTLRGQVEQLTHQLEQMQAQQKNLYSDLDQRLEQNRPTPAQNQAQPQPQAANSEPETTTAPPSVDNIPVKRAEIPKSVNPAVNEATAKQTKAVVASIQSNMSPTAGQPNVAEEQKIYQSAYNLIKQKKYNEAVSVLQKMLKKYPSGQFASNAHYWLGELFGLMGKHDQALTEFSAIVKSYPHSPRVSDAQLKVGLILASQLKWSDAKVELKKVINQYPGTSSAKVATEQLKQLKQAGH